MKGWLIAALSIAVLLSGTAIAGPDEVTESDNRVSITKVGDGDGEKVVIRLSSAWQGLPKGTAEMILKQLKGMLGEAELKSVLKQLVEGKQEITVKADGVKTVPQIWVQAKIEPFKLTPGIRVVPSHDIRGRLVEIKPGEQGMVVVKRSGEDGDVTLKARKIRLLAEKPAQPDLAELKAALEKVGKDPETIKKILVRLKKAPQGGMSFIELDADKPEILIEEEIEIEGDVDAKAHGPHRIRVRAGGHDAGKLSAEIQKQVEAQLRGGNLSPEIMEKVLQALKHGKGGNVWVGSPTRVWSGGTHAWPQPRRMPQMPQQNPGGCPHCNPRPQMQGNVVGALRALTLEISMLRAEMRAMRQAHRPAPPSAPLPQIRFGVVPGGAGGKAGKAGAGFGGGAGGAGGAAGAPARRYAVMKAAPAVRRPVVAVQKDSDSLAAQTQQLKKEVQVIHALLKKLAAKMAELQDK